MLALWNVEGVFESSEQRLANQSRMCKNNGWLSDVEIEEIKRSIESKVLERKLLGNERSGEKLGGRELDGEEVNGKCCYEFEDIAKKTCATKAAPVIRLTSCA